MDLRGRLEVQDFQVFPARPVVSGPWDPQGTQDHQVNQVTTASQVRRAHLGHEDPQGVQALPGSTGSRVNQDLWAHQDQQGHRDLKDSQAMWDLRERSQGLRACQEFRAYQALQDRLDPRVVKDLKAIRDLVDHRVTLGQLVQLAP